MFLFTQSGKPPASRSLRGLLGQTLYTNATCNVRGIVARATECVKERRPYEPTVPITQQTGY